MAQRICKYCKFIENKFDEQPCDACRGGSKFEDCTKPKVEKPVEVKTPKTKKPLPEKLERKYREYREKKPMVDNKAQMGSRRVGAREKRDNRVCPHCGKPCWPHSWCEEMRKKYFSFSKPD